MPLIPNVPDPIGREFGEHLAPDLDPARVVARDRFGRTYSVRQRPYGLLLRCRCGKPGCLHTTTVRLPDDADAFRAEFTVEEETNSNG